MGAKGVSSSLCIGTFLFSSTIYKPVSTSMDAEAGSYGVQPPCSNLIRQLDVGRAPLELVKMDHELLLWDVDMLDPIHSI